VTDFKPLNKKREVKQITLPESGPQGQVYTCPDEVGGKEVKTC